MHIFIGCDMTTESYIEYNEKRIIQLVENYKHSPMPPWAAVELAQLYSNLEYHKRLHPEKYSVEK